MRAAPTPRRAYAALLLLVGCVTAAALQQHSYAPRCLESLAAGEWRPRPHKVFGLPSWLYDHAAAQQQGCRIMDYAIGKRNETKAIAPRLVFLSDSVDDAQTRVACRLLHGKDRKHSVLFKNATFKDHAVTLCRLKGGFHVQSTFITSLSEETDPLRRPTKVDDAAAVYAELAGQSGPPQIVAVAVNFWEMYFVLRHTHPQWIFSRHIPQASVTWYQQMLEAFLRRVQQAFPNAGMYLYCLHHVPSKRWDVKAMLTHVPAIGNDAKHMLGNNYERRLAGAFKRIHYISELNAAAAEVAKKMQWHVFNREAMLATRPQREHMFLKDGVHLQPAVYPELLNVYYSLASGLAR